MPWEQDLERAITDADAQSTASSDAAMMVGLDHMSTAGTDNNTMSGFSSESGQQEASPLEERDTKHGLYENYLRDMDREFPEASAVAARQEEEEGDKEEARGEGQQEEADMDFQEETGAGNVETSVSTLSLSEHITVVETLRGEEVITRVESRGGEDGLEKWDEASGLTDLDEKKLKSRVESAEPGGDEGSMETGDVGQAGKISPQDRFDYADGNDDDADDAREGFFRGANVTVSYTTTTTDLEEGKGGPVVTKVTKKTGERAVEIESFARVTRSEHESSFSSTRVVEVTSTKLFVKEDERISDVGQQLADPNMHTRLEEGELARLRLRPSIFPHLSLSVAHLN